MDISSQQNRCLLSNGAWRRHDADISVGKIDIFTYVGPVAADHDPVRGVCSAFDCVILIVVDLTSSMAEASGLLPSVFIPT